MNLVILLVLLLFVERYSIYNPQFSNFFENYPGIVVRLSAVNFLFKQDGIGQFGQYHQAMSRRLQTAKGRSDGPFPSIIARNRSLETISGKYKRRENSDTTGTVVRSSETAPRGELVC